MAKRIPLIAGNWKMYKTQKEAKEFIEKIAPLLEKSDISVYLAPPYTAIYAAAATAKGSHIVIGAQNMNAEKEGAFTGEVSADMLKDAGAGFVLIGHSERRQLFHETDLVINEKIKSALNSKLVPVLCIGETQEERDKNQMEAVLTRQLEEALRGLSSEELKKIIIAYEPVWAIGTGLTATPEIAEDAHRFCRELLAKRFDQDVAQTILILYGGSVKPETIEKLIKMENIDGALIGGASLQPETFAQIVNHVTKLRKEGHL